MRVIRLKSLKPDVYWNPDDDTIRRLRNMNHIDIDSLESEDILYLLKELDRRFTQLRDKIAYEYNS